MKDLIINHIKKVADLNGYDSTLAINQIKAESNFNVNARSSAGALGVAQFMPATYSEVFNKLSHNRGYYERIFLCQFDDENPLDFKQSIGCYFYYMYNYIPGTLKRIGVADTVENRLRAYNAGPGNVLKSRNFKETNNYVKRILGDSSSFFFNYCKCLVH